MKKRLLGLVALTLCALLALAPASAALAQWFYDSDYTPAYMLRLGDLIDAGTTVYSSFESGRDHDLKYYNGVGDLEDDPDKKVTIDPESSVKLAEAGTLAGFENGMWSCMNEWQVTTGLERFGKIVHTVDLPDNQLLVVSSGLQSCGSV